MDRCHFRLQRGDRELDNGCTHGQPGQADRHQQPGRVQVLGKLSGPDTQPHLPRRDQGDVLEGHERHRIRGRKGVFRGRESVQEQPALLPEDQGGAHKRVGERHHEPLLPVVQVCERHGLDCIDFLRDRIQHLRAFGSPIAGGFIRHVQVHDHRHRPELRHLQPEVHHRGGVHTRPDRPVPGGHRIHCGDILQEQLRVDDTHLQGIPERCRGGCHGIKSDLYMDQDKS